jgi:DNA polymerase-3 subunit gamma/tau
VVEIEKLNIEPEALTLIARQSSGGLRDAISLLDQMASTGKPVTLSLTQTVLGTATTQTVVDLINSVHDKDAAKGMDSLHQAFDSGSDPRLLARQVVDYLRELLLIQMGNTSQVDLATDMLSQAEKHAKAFSTSDVLRMIKSFNTAATDQRGGWQPSLPMELALAEIMESQPTGSNAAPLPKNKPEILFQARPADVHPQKTADKPRTSHVDADKKEKKEADNEDASGSDITLGQIIKAWKLICAEVKTNDPNLNALLNSSHPLELKKDTLVLGFASDILRSKADTPEQLERTRQAVAKITGADLKIKCVVTTTKHSAPPDVKPDGMVAAALKSGGEIVDIQ